ncbi:MAG: hypothetical protein AAF799_14980 [Myxococcota bacterium]
MREQVHHSLFGLISLLVACGPNVNGTGDGTGRGSSGSGSGSGSTAAEPTSAGGSDPTAATGSMGGTGSTGAADDATDGTVTNGSATTTTVGSSGEPGDDSSGDPPPDGSYPSCAERDCPEPYDVCFEPGGGDLGDWCTFECEGNDECPDPSSGTATPLCAGPPGQDICLLDCSKGDCPDGMICIGLGMGGNAMRCAWPPED